jgi:hypothetical protein
VKNRFQSLPFKCNLQRYIEYWLATLWMLMVTEGEHREDWTVYELAKEGKRAPASWWTVPPMPLTHEPPPPPPLTSDVVATMVSLLQCESYAHKTSREICAGLAWSLVTRDFSLERHFVRLGAIKPLLKVVEGGTIVAAARREAALAAARNAAKDAREAWEAKKVADGGFYGSDPAASKRKAEMTAAAFAAAAAEQAVAPQDVTFDENPAPPVLRDRAAALLLQFAENDPSNMVGLYKLSPKP